jgi:nitrous oxide reductase accessory protein NosL
MNSRITILCSVLAVLLVTGCPKKNSVAKTSQLKAEKFAGHECAACGMIVRDQSSPRGQVVHRDGTRKYFCSVADMMTYLLAPSPHGKTKAVFVETLDPKVDPTIFSKPQRPWRDSEKSTYVLGVDKPRVMGKPILVYETTKQAKAVAEKYKGKVVGWSGLLATFKKPATKK